MATLIQSITCHFQTHHPHMFCILAHLMEPLELNWDTCIFREVSSFCTGPSDEIFSFSFGGLANNLLVAGSNSQILLWDVRNNKQVACLEESHTDDVTQVHFIPEHPSRLLSASVDGLMCIFDTSGDINDEEFFCA